jgi:phosphate transport system substrate-binding protein
MKKINTPNPVGIVLAVFISLFVLSCNTEVQESPTRGRLTMISSEDVYPVIDLQVQDFTRIYTETSITHLSSSTRDAIVQLLNDSVKLIVSPREFNDEETKVIRDNDLDVTTTKIAYDAVVVIVHRNNAVSKISIATLRNIVTGKTQRWSEVPGSSLASAIVIGLGEPNSGVHEYVKGRIAGNASFATTLFPCSSTPEVLSFVRDHPNAIGFAPVAWLTGLSDTVKVLEVGDPEFKSDSTVTELEYFAPHQAHIYRNYYPLSRSVYLFTHNEGRGVARGFAAFAAGADGQKIIVKNGLVPATMPVRLVQLQQQ